MTNRYDISGVQGAFEPGSGEQVLANFLGVADPNEMADAELILLQQLYQAVFANDLTNRRITLADLKTWHRRWLGNVYAWAGEERSVTMLKGGFPFANATLLPRLLADFERDCLTRYTPCRGKTDDELVEAIAVTHVELILIHPFREGNGRLSRLLADVMAVQAGVGLLDYSAWDQNKAAYFAAIQSGLRHDYRPMAQWVRLAINRESRRLPPTSG